MVETSDLKETEQTYAPLKWRQWLLVFFLALGLASLSWGTETVVMGVADGIEVKAEFGAALTSDNGSLVFQRSFPVDYKIIVTNRGNKTLERVEIQSGMRSNGSLLPGNALSSPHKTVISPGQSYEYEASYSLPDGQSIPLAQLMVSLQFAIQNRLQSKQFQAPRNLSFE